MRYPTARLGQAAERKALNLVVVEWIPAVSVLERAATSHLVEHGSEL